MQELNAFYIIINYIMENESYNSFLSLYDILIINIAKIIKSYINESKNSDFMILYEINRFTKKYKYSEKNTKQLVLDTIIDLKELDIDIEKDISLVIYLFQNDKNIYQLLEKIIKSVDNIKIIYQKMINEKTLYSKKKNIKNAAFECIIIYYTLIKIRINYL